MDQQQTWTGARASGSGAARTLLFANDKSSGKTTTASAVIVRLLQRHPGVLSAIEVREYERAPRLGLIFRAGDGIGAVIHCDARNEAAFDSARELASDPNATPWDDLLYDIGVGKLIVDLGSNTFTEICRILDDEPRPVFPEGGRRVGAVIPVTTAADSIESATMAIGSVIGWGPATTVFVVEQEYLGRFGPAMREWQSYCAHLLEAAPGRVQVIRLDRLMIADIGPVVFRRIDRMIGDAEAALRAPDLVGGALVRALRTARAEIAWGSRTLEAVAPIAEWFAA